MGMKYIDRDGENNIIAAFTMPQRLDHEMIDETDQEFVDFANKPTVEEVKIEAARRIGLSGHDWMIIREMSTGGSEPCPQSIKDYAAAIRADSATLESSLPVDYTDDSHWTPLP